jgi:uncharacterized protein GlcG (DUF336 family)
MRSPSHVSRSLAALVALCASSSLAAADGLIATHRLPASLANAAVAEAVAACARQNYAETAVVVDADGVRLAELRGDGAGVHTLDSAYAKAYTAATFKADSTALAERAKTNPAFMILLSRLPNLIAVGGGLVIKSGNEVVGAIGAAGAPGFDLDDGCAKAGLDKIMGGLK